MTLVGGGIRGQAVQVLVAVLAVQPHALGVSDNQLLSAVMRSYEIGLVIVNLAISECGKPVPCFLDSVNIGHRSTSYKTDYGFYLKPRQDNVLKLKFKGLNAYF
jgi:hypothetical protein